MLVCQFSWISFMRFVDPQLDGIHIIFTQQKMITKAYRRAFSSAGELLTWGQTTYGWGRKVDNKLRVPGRVEGFDDVVSVSTGAYHILIQTKTNQVFSAGLGDNGRLGHGNTNTLEVPESISSLAGLNIRQLAAGFNFSMALTDSGDVYSWGYGGSSLGPLKYIYSTASPLGFGDSGDVSTPRLIEDLPPSIYQIAAGEDISLAVDQSGQIYGWGQSIKNLDQQPSSTPVKLEEVNFFLHKNHANVTKIASVGKNAFFLLDNGRLYAVGANCAGFFGTRLNPRVIEDNQLYSLTKVVDEDYKDQRIVDFKLSANSLIFITDAGSVFYTGMHNKPRPEPLKISGAVKSIFATYDSVGVITQNGQIKFVNDAFIEDSLKKDNMITNLDPALKNAFEIGGTHKLRYALVGN